jgi:hypothetical protein
MDPYLYCEETIADLLAERPDRRSQPEDLQRVAVLAFLAQRRLSERDFARELRELAAGGNHGRPAVAAAARAILRDWEARVAQGV